MIISLIWHCITGMTTQMTKRDPVDANSMKSWKSQMQIRLKFDFSQLQDKISAFVQP